MHFSLNTDLFSPVSSVMYTISIFFVFISSMTIMKTLKTDHNTEGLQKPAGGVDLQLTWVRAIISHDINIGRFAGNTPYAHPKNAFTCQMHT